MGRVAFCLTEADAPVAVDATEHQQGFIGSVGSFWLAVPPKTEQFALYASGEGGECAHVFLTDPQGICVWDRDNVSSWERAARPVDGDDEKAIPRGFRGRPLRRCRDSRLPLPLPWEDLVLPLIPYPIAIFRGCVSGFFCTVTVRTPFSSVAASEATSAISGRSTDAA